MLLDRFLSQTYFMSKYKTGTKVYLTHNNYKIKKWKLQRPVEVYYNGLHFKFFVLPLISVFLGELGSSLRLISHVATSSHVSLNNTTSYWFKNSGISHTFCILSFLLSGLGCISSAATRVEWFNAIESRVEKTLKERNSAGTAFVVLTEMVYYAQFNGILHVKTGF